MKLNKKIIVWLTVLGVIIAVAICFVFTNISRETSEETELVIDGIAESGIEIPEIDLDILDAESFKELKVYSDLPVRAGETGNFSLFGY